METRKKKQENQRIKERPLLYNESDALFIISWCLFWLKNERAFPCNAYDLDLMKLNKQVKYKFNEKVFLSDKDSKIYQSEISVKYPNLDNLCIDQRRNLTKLCSGYLCILEANNNVSYPFTIESVKISYLSKKRITLKIILRGR